MAIRLVVHYHILNSCRLAHILIYLTRGPSINENGLCSEAGSLVPLSRIYLISILVYPGACSGDWYVSRYL
jgi:hypothetical protein